MTDSTTDPLAGFRDANGICNVTVCGAGNACHAIVGYVGAKPSCKVNLWSTFKDEAERFEAKSRKSGVTVKNDIGPDVVGHPTVVSKHAKDVIPQSQIIFLSLPAFAHEPYLRAMKSYIQPGAVVVAMPAQGGFDVCLRDALGDVAESITVVGSETLPWAVRLDKFGEHVEILGTKQDVDFTVSPRSAARPALAALQYLFGRLPRLCQVDNFLGVTMMNINSVWHPCITQGAYRNWDGKPFKKAPLFYEGVDPFTASTLSAVSLEILNLKQVIQSKYPGLDLRVVRHVEEWMRRSYAGDMPDDRTLQTCINCNKGYKGLKHPCTKLKDGVLMPNWKYRYLSEDVPMGLVVTRGIAELFHAKTPVMDSVIVWCQLKMGKEFISPTGSVVDAKDLMSTRAPQRYGYRDAESFVRAMKYVDNPTAKL